MIELTKPILSLVLILFGGLMLLSGINGTRNAKFSQGAMIVLGFALIIGAMIIGR